MKCSNYFHVQHHKEEEAGEKYEAMYGDYTSYLLIGIGSGCELLLQLLTIKELYNYGQLL